MSAPQPIPRGLKLATGDQSGFALLALMIVFLGFGIFAISGTLSALVESRQQQADKKTQQALLEAKQLLLSYAVNYSVEFDLGKMGRLPCPDSAANLPAAIATPSAREGIQDNVCGPKNVNAVGYFPFKSLGLGKLEDGSQECLWYVVTGNYKNSPTSELVNWNSLGTLNVEDENALLQHGAATEDFPIALIISPGDSRGQNRTPEATGALTQCGGNYTLASYLEGGPAINYAVDLPLTPDWVWSFLRPTRASKTQDVDYNDRVIAVYRDELWDIIRDLSVLSFDDATPVDTLIEELTQSLAQCLADYGNRPGNNQRRLPYPAPIAMADYRPTASYDDVAGTGVRFGRLPNTINNPNSAPFLQPDFVTDGVGGGYCEGTGAIDFASREGQFWENWKDHFFYVLSEDFDSQSGTTGFVNKCVSGLDCVTVDGKADKLAAIVIFAGDLDAGQSRTWDGVIDDKQTVANYLEGDFATANDDGDQDFTLAGNTDYAFCVQMTPGGTLSAVKCSDL